MVTLAWGIDIGKEITDFFNKMLTSVLDFFIKLLSGVIDQLDQNIDSIQTWYGVLFGISTTALLAVVLARVLVNTIKQADDSSDVTISNVIMDTIKAGVAIPLMVFGFGFIQSTIVIPVAKLIFGLNSKFGADAIKGLNSVGAVNISTDVTLILLIFFTIVIGFFFIKASVYYVEMAWFFILIPLVAVSIATENFDYVSTWWKKIFYLNFTFLLQILSLTLMVQAFLNVNHGLIYFMAAIGFGFTTLRPAFVIDQMWTSTGLAKAGTQGAMRMAMRQMSGMFSRGR